jgi:FkbM family methyltransferase
MADARTLSLRPLKRLIHHSLQSVGWDLRRVGNFREPSLADFLRAKSIDLVLDVGANEGQFAIGLRDAGYAGEIVSFEPISFVFDKLAANAARDRRWTVRRQALGDRVGVARIEVTASTVYSSMKPQAAVRRESGDPDVAVIATETVELTTLDDIFSEFAGREVFLKLDTQGFEHQILMGATRTLPELAAAQLELSVRHYYEGVWPLAEAIGFMARAGFVVAQVRPVDYVRGTASLAELDCVFERQAAMTCARERIPGHNGALAVEELRS